MPIVCPHCSTSYGIDPTKLGEAGRTVRCSRCKEVWLARAEDAVDHRAPAMAGAEDHESDQASAAGWDTHASEQDEASAEAPHVESPSIVAGWHDDGSDDQYSQPDAPASRASWFKTLMKPKTAAGRTAQRKTTFGLATACAAMGALVLAIMVCRTDMVRLMPQTAAFYKLVGLDVNLRGLKFKDVTISSEMVEGKPVLVIEGAIMGESKKPIELPRLRFSVRDAHGAEIYAWNALLEQSVLQPGERAVFKSRLASPPAEGRNIDVRFFNKRDITGGHA